MATDAPQGPRILVVDDHRDTAVTLARLLGAEGFVAQTAFDAEQAINACERGPQDVLVLDLTLPDMSGYELLLHLRGHTAAPAIAYTGSGGEPEARCALSAGFAVHLLKPATYEQIRSAIAAALQSSPPPDLS